MEIVNELEVSTLILKVRECDDAAFSELVKRYTPMMNKVVSGFRGRRVREDEAFSEACVALHRAAMSYDLSRTEVTFGLYARICVYRRLCDLVGKEAKDECIVDFDVDALAVQSGIESRLVGRENMQEALAVARTVLSEYEYEILLMYLQGYTTAAMAKELSKTPKSVDNAKARMMKRLRESSGDFPKFD